jgi:hypothetical protein
MSATRARCLPRSFDPQLQTKVDDGFPPDAQTARQRGCCERSLHTLSANY